MTQQTVNFCVYHPPLSRKNKQTDSMFIDQLHSLFEHCNSLHGSSIILGDFNMHYPWTQPLLEWWISWPLSIWPRLSVSPRMTKDTSWTGCYTHLRTILCSLPPCLTPSPLTTPASSATSTSPFLPPGLRTSWREISAPSTALPWKQTWPRVSPTCLALALMTWTLCWQASLTTMLLLCAAESIRRRMRPGLAVSQRRSGF